MVLIGSVTRPNTKLTSTSNNSVHTCSNQALLFFPESPHPGQSASRITSQLDRGVLGTHFCPVRFCSRDTGLQSWGSTNHFSASPRQKEGVHQGLLIQCIAGACVRERVRPASRCATGGMFCSLSLSTPRAGFARRFLQQQRGDPNTIRAQVQYPWPSVFTLPTKRA